MSLLRKYIDIVNEAVLRSSDGKPVTDGSGNVVGTSSTTPTEYEAAQAEVGKGNLPNVGDGGASSGSAKDGIKTGPELLNPPAPADTATATPVEPAAEPAPVVEPAAAPAPEPATVAAPANRDSMTFSQAFADARKNKESVFAWKGKQYTTQLATPKPASNVATKPANVAAKTGSTLTPQQDAQIKALMAQRLAAFNKGDNATVANVDKAIQAWGTTVNQAGVAAKPATESVSFSQDQALASIVHLAGLR